MQLPARQARLESIIKDKLFRISAHGFAVYLLVRDGYATLIGTGGDEHLPLILGALEEQGLGLPDLRAILLTHAVVAHNSKASWLQRRSEARVYINRLEMARLNLQLDGRMRRSPRVVLDRWNARKGRYSAPEVAIYIGEGDLIDLWYGLRVVHLPGPTSGHCGFYCRHLNALFTGILPLNRRTQIRQRALLRDVVSARESLARVNGFGADTIYSSIA